MNFNAGSDRSESLADLILAHRGDPHATAASPTALPLDFIARLAALVPTPRVNLTRYHGVFAPNSAWRAQVTPAARGKRVGAQKRRGHPPSATPPDPRRNA